MSTPFPNRQDLLFGRAADLQALSNRVRQKGLTALIGRPKMGKTWLLTELCRSSAEQGMLVGYCESRGETADLLLRSVSDLYERWLGEASFRDQAQSLFEQHKGNLIGKAGQVLDTILKSGAVWTGPPGELIAEAFSRLLTADRDLKTGSLEFKRLSYDQAKDLVSRLAEITGRPILLVLDAWEKSPQAELESAILDAYLHHLDEWPMSHLVVAIRSETEECTINHLVQDLLDSSAAAQPHDLQAMQIGPEEEPRLISYLHKEVPATAKMTAPDLFQLIHGNPGVLERWNFRNPQTPDALKKEADDAHFFRYHEIKTLLSDLDGPSLKVAARIALYPPFGSPEDWETARPIVQADMDEGILIELQAKKLLDPRQPYPSYGHATRHEAVRRWFLQGGQGLPYLRAGKEFLTIELASRIRGLAENERAYAETLATLALESSEIPVSTPVQGLLLSGLSLWRIPFSQKIDVSLGKQHPNVAPLLAMGLFNTLVDAKAEAEFRRRDTLLDELRALRAQAPEDAAVRKLLAMGLVNTLVAAKAEADLPRRDTLLEELRALRAQAPDDAAVRDSLAMGLFNTLNHAKAEKDLRRRDALLKELRTLRAQAPDDAAVREHLASGLFNTLVDAKAKEDLPRRDALLEELRTLRAQAPDDAAVRDSLASGLFNTLNHAKAEEDLRRRDALLKELRTLRAQAPDDAAVRDSLARGLVNTMLDAKDEEDLRRRDALLEELRALRQAAPAELDWIADYIDEKDDEKR